MATFISALDEKKIILKKQVHRKVLLNSAQVSTVVWVFKGWDLSMHSFKRSKVATIIHGSLVSNLDHCNVLYGRMPLKGNWKLQKVQNEAARFLSASRHSM